MFDLFGTPLKASPDAFTKELSARKTAPAPDAKRDPRPHAYPHKPVAWTVGNSDRDMGKARRASDVTFIGPLDLRRTEVTRFDAGTAEGSDYLQRKGARGLPMGEMSTFTDDPDRLRVGLLQIEVQSQSPRAKRKNGAR